MTKNETLEQPVQEPVGDEWTPCMKLPVVVHVRQQRPGEAHVSTREGITPVKPDDLIMRGVSGEEYPIGRAIFEQTYSLDIAPPLPMQEPVTWDKPSASFNEWWNGDYEDPANPFEKDSAAWWAWAGWKAAQTVQEPVAWLYPEGLEALQNGKCWTTYPTEHEDCNIPLYTASPQRPWVGLTKQDMPSGEDPMFDHQYFIAGMVYAAKVLKERNT